MTTQMNQVLQHLHAVSLLHDAGKRTDGQLLESFVSRREEAALEALVRRHGPMVYGATIKPVKGKRPDSQIFFGRAGPWPWLAEARCLAGRKKCINSALAGQ